MFSSPFNARPNQTLEEHSREVAEICFRKASKAGLGMTGFLIGWGHDLGKAKMSFQLILNPVNTLKKSYVKVDHATAGGQFIWKHTAPSSSEKRLFRQLSALTCCSHHNGVLIDCFLGHESDFIRRMEKSDKDTSYMEVLENLTLDFQRDYKTLLNSKDLESEIRNFRKTHLTRLGKESLAFGEAFAARFLLSCLIEGDHSSAAGIEVSLKTSRDNISKTPQENPALPDWEKYEKLLLKALNGSGFDSASDMGQLRSKFQKYATKREELCPKAIIV